MEELLVYVLLLAEEIVTDISYKNRLDELFLENPESEILLHLEWESDLKKAIVYIRTHINYSIFNYELFGKILMDKLSDYYYNCSDINKFGNEMYLLWTSLPTHIQGEQPFHILSYADDPLGYGDENQTRKLYEDMFAYYRN